MIDRSLMLGVYSLKLSIAIRYESFHSGTDRTDQAAAANRDHRGAGGRGFRPTGENGS